MAHSFDIQTGINPQEEDHWLDFVSSVFTKTSRQYFWRHIHNDYDPDIHSHILVATIDGEFVGTLRVFQRTVLHQTQLVALAGIGEVSVSPNHRRKGIASRLLQEAIKHIQQGNPAPVDPEFPFVWSALHTGKAAPLYQSQGWFSIPLVFQQYEPQTFQNLPTTISDGHEHDQVRPICLDTDLQDVKRIYHEYSSRFSGCFERSQDKYWRNWTMSENPSIVVLESQGKVIAMCGPAYHPNFEDSGERVVIKDFSVDCNQIQAEEAFLLMFYHWKRLFSSQIQNLESLVVVLPWPVCKDWSSRTDLSPIRVDGTMYRVILPKDNDRIPFDEHNQVFWLSDGF